MKKLNFFFSMAFILMVAFACTSKNNSGSAVNSEDPAPADSPAMQLLNSVPFTEEGLASMITTPKEQELTDVEYEALWLAYSKININENNMELDNTPELKAIRTLMREHKRPSQAGKIHESLLASPSPQVRGLAMGQFTTLIGLKNENIQKMLNVLNNEQNPFVLQYGIKALSNELKSPDVAKFVFAQAKSDNKFVRKAAAGAVGNFWSIGVDSIADVAKRLLADADNDVRKTMLRSVGKLADDQFVPELVKVLEDDSQYRLHDDAMQSLYTMWYDYPFHKNTSKAAFDATINYLKKTPRTEKIPAWNAIGQLKSRADRDYPAWQSKATYYNNAEYIKLMTEIALDANANWMGRSAAIDVIEKIGTKADLEKLKTAIAANSSDAKKDLLLQNLDRKLK